METTKQSKEDYLKRYLSGYTEEKKKHKKKKKHSVIKPRTRIFDDDVDLSQLNPNSEDKDDVLFVDEAPQVAEVVDERPLEEIELEKYRTGKKWRIINDDEGENQINSDEEEKIRLDKKSYQNRLHDSDSDQSPPRKKNMRHDSDSDQSPPRKKNVRHDSDSDQSPTRKKNVRHDSDSDQSPPRKKNVRHDTCSDSDQSPPRKKNVRHGSDSDQSPPRKKQSLRKSRESDQSPRRKKKRQQDSGSDQSPPRRRKHLLDDKSKHKDEGCKLKKTLSGKSAGLQDALSMRMENQQKRQSDKEALDRLDHETSGKNAGTVYRDKSGKKRDLHKEKLKHAEKLKKEEEDSKQFKEWGKGVVQTKKHQETIVDHMKEMAKPFARYEGDRDLEGMLKNQEREGDPMLAFIKKKSARTNAKNNVPEKPKYKGRAPPPNRFNIPPGYRWDGVDRSNGFEKKHFERLSSKKAMEEVKYKWNVEDM